MTDNCMSGSPSSARPMDDRLSGLLDDEDFQEIQRSRSSFNVFEAVGAVRGELRHSNFLGYLLSPSRPHGLGAKPLQLILRKVLELIDPEDRPISSLELLVADLDGAIVHRESDSIDLLLEIEALNLILLIENKIRARAGEGQLSRYREIIERRYPGHQKLLVFLRPMATLPTIRHTTHSVMVNSRECWNHLPARLARDGMPRSL